MAIHKRILEWQAAHPNITWIAWGHRLGNRSGNPALAPEERIGAAQRSRPTAQMSAFCYRRGSAPRPTSTRSSPGLKDAAEAFLDEGAILQMCDTYRSLSGIAVMTRRATSLGSTPARMNAASCRLGHIVPVRRSDAAGRARSMRSAYA
jgi:hypothetical protein